jgi:ribosomal protein L11 methyltransferase
VKTWVEVRLKAPAEAAELFVDFFYGLTGAGVQVTDPAEGPGPMEVIGFLEPGPKAQDQRLALEEFGRHLQALAPGQNLELTWGGLEEQDWGRAWKEHFHPQEVADGLVVAPPWEQPRPQAGKEVLIIDPGQAFGTGQHESTKLCLEHIATLARQSRLPSQVLDLGCGTGVLALAALLFGARTALCLDLDPLALEATALNARLNGLEQRIEASLTPLAQIQERFPLVMANLTAKDITGLAPELAAHLAPGGQLVASGLLQEQAAPVRQALEAQGLDPVSENSQGEWACVVMTCT